MANPVQKTELSEPRADASKELHELLLELAVAVSRYAMYPGGHPSQATSCAALAARVAALTVERATLSIGVARQQLVVEGVPTSATHPLLRALADRLRRQYLGALVLSRGVARAELEALLRLLALEPEQGEVPLGMGDGARLRVSERVRLYPVTYDRLELVSDGSGETGTGAAGVRASELWLGLARAALARGEEEALPEVDAPEEVARAINAHAAAPAYDQVIVGYLTQLARELKVEDAAATSPVRRRLSRMMVELDASTLGRLVEMGGDVAERQRFLRDATDAFASGTVIDVVRAAAGAGGQTISDSMLRMLVKLAGQAESGGAVRPGADAALRAQVHELIEGWSLADPNPEGYTLALERIARAGSDPVASGSAFAAEPLRVVQMALEVDVVGSALRDAVGSLLAERRLVELLDALDGAPADSTAAAAIWRHLEVSDVVRDLLTTEPVDFATLDRMLVHIPAETSASLLLDRISESAARATRMGVFQRLVARGGAIVPAIAERLMDSRWYVQRNMLALLAEIGRCPAGIAPLELARHERAAVRREALHLALQSERDRERAIAMALADRDERVVRVGVRAAQESGLPRTALPLALKALDDAALPGELRLQVLRTLGALHDPLLLEALLRRVAPGRTLLGKPRLAARTPELATALGILARGWPQDARVQAVLARARASGDPALLAAVQGSAK